MQIFQLVNDSLELWQKLQQDGHATKSVFDHYLFAAELIEINLKKTISLSFEIAAKSMLLYFVLDGDEGTIQHEHNTIAKTEKGSFGFRILKPGSYNFLLPPGKHKILQFIIRPEWMEHHSKSHPKLTKFIIKAEQGIDQIYHLPKCKINGVVKHKLLLLERLHFKKVDDMEVETLRILNKLMALYLDLIPVNEYMGYVTPAEEATEIVNYILENYRNPELVSIRNLCSEFYLSERKLFRIFKEKTGFGVQTYILQLKMDLSWSMVRHHHIPFNQIAMQLGYKSLFQFSAAFKKHFKCSPKTLRAEQDTP